MKQFEYTITDEVGIHARPAGNLVKEAKKFKSRAIITFDGKSAECKQLLFLMKLGVKKGSQITVTVEGEDEDEAAASLEAFFKNNL